MTQERKDKIIDELLPNKAVEQLHSTTDIIKSIMRAAESGKTELVNTSCKKPVSFTQGEIKKLLNDKEKEDILSKNIKDRAVSEFNKISEKLAEYDKREDINTVVIVTHTVPKGYFSRDISTDHNSQFHNLHSKKLKYWFYGHNHVGMEKEINQYP